MECRSGEVRANIQVYKCAVLKVIEANLKVIQLGSYHMFKVVLKNIIVRLVYHEWIYDVLTMMVVTVDSE